jgi:hypothetical protein
VGALSDPTIDLGLKGLNEEQYSIVLQYIESCMRRSLSTLRVAQEAALDGDFQHMRADDQYELAGAYAVLYLTAQLKGNKKAEQDLLQEAHAKRILVPENTPLGQALLKIKYLSPAEVAASLGKPAAVTPAQQQKA